MGDEYFAEGDLVEVDVGGEFDNIYLGSIIKLP